VIASAIALCCATVSEAEDLSAARPKLSIPELTYDYGTIEQGAHVKHDFVLKNDGNMDLTIQRMVPGCGCTAVSTNNNTVPAGATGAITVEFDSSGFEGEKYKPVTVYTNDPDKSSFTLALKGNIESDISVTPKNIFFGEVTQGQKSLAQDVIVEIKGNSDSKIEEVKSYSKNLSVNQLENGDKKRKFTVSVNPEVPLGELRDRIVVSIVGKNSKTVNVPVFAAIQGTLRLSPSNVSFGVIEGKEPLTRSIKFENLGKQPVKVTELVSDNPALTAKLKPIKDGKIYVIELALDPSKIEKDLRAKVDVLVDQKDQKLALNVYGVVPPKF